MWCHNHEGKKKDIKHVVSLRKQGELRLSPGPSILLWPINDDKIQRISENLTSTIFTLDLSPL